MARAHFHNTETRPWGIVAGLLMAAFVTLVGVVRGFDPLVILQRACYASIAAGLVVSIFVGIPQLLFGKKRKSWQG